jgi:hypothetical protein
MGAGDVDQLGRSLVARSSAAPERRWAQIGD